MLTVWSPTGPLHRVPSAGAASLGQEHGGPVGYKELTSLISDAWKLVEKFLLSHNYKSLISDDGIHPTAEGHTMIRREIGNMLKAGV